MFGMKTEFKNENSKFFNKEGASNAIKSIDREFGESSKISDSDFKNINDNSFNIPTKKLTEKLPPSLILRVGEFPEKLALLNLSKNLTDLQKKGVESILSCPPEVAQRRVELLDRVLTKYFPDTWDNIKQNDFLEIEILLEGWGIQAKVSEAKEYIKDCKIRNEGGKE